MVQVGVVVHIMPLLVADPAVEVLTAIMLVAKAQPAKATLVGLVPTLFLMLRAAVAVLEQWAE
jgi:hypothetical protein